MIPLIERVRAVEAQLKKIGSALSEQEMISPIRLSGDRLTRQVAPNPEVPRIPKNPATAAFRNAFTE